MTQIGQMNASFKNTSLGIGRRGVEEASVAKNRAPEARHYLAHVGRRGKRLAEGQSPVRGDTIHAVLWIVRAGFINVFWVEAPTFRSGSVVFRPREIARLQMNLGFSPGKQSECQRHL